LHNLTNFFLTKIVIEELIWEDVENPGMLLSRLSDSENELYDLFLAMLISSNFLTSESCNLT
jgi:hypothetical protein